MVHIYIYVCIYIYMYIYICTIDLYHGTIYVVYIDLTSFRIAFPIFSQQARKISGDRGDHSIRPGGKTRMTGR